ncbi:MAG: TetR family transcriptional regulator [Actinomycetes bacterium]
MSDDVLTTSQIARRDRITTAALELAAEGGFDAVQMREVAARADVALGTLYRYFPSKEYLLVSVMASQIDGLAERLALRPPEGTDPVERVVDVLGRATRALERQPNVNVAMIRALVSGNADLAPAVSANRDGMRRIITDALGEESTPDAAALDPDRDRAIDLLNDVWLAALVAWITGVQPPGTVLPKLESAARALLG